MKKAFIIVAVTLFVGACSSKKGDNSESTAQAYGCVVPGQVMVHGVCPNPGGSNYHALTFQQWVNVTNPTIYAKFLQDLYYCPPSKCGGIHYMTVRIDLFSTTLPAQGYVAIGTGYDTVFSRMETAFPIQGGFEFRVTGKFNINTPSSWDDVVRIVVTVPDTSLSAVDVVVYYNDVAFATGRLNRLPSYYH